MEALNTANSYNTPIGYTQPPISLIQIDSHLRNPDFTVQCLGLSKIPKLLNSNPNPDLVNSVYLKLAEYFRKDQSSNYLRTVIIRVIKETAPSNIHQMINYQDIEFINRISFVMNSNDPTKRTLTIRLLGICAVISVNKTNVKHYVRQSILSQHLEERIEALRVHMQRHFFQ